jgi:hypothetical protein
MPSWVVDIGVVALVLGVTYALISEGLWGAALIFFNVLFSIMIALNFYEPLAKLISDNASAVAPFADMLCLGGLFAVSLIVFRLVTDNIAPTQIRFPAPVYQLGRLLFGLAAACLVVGFVLLVFHTAPVHKKIFGKMDASSKPPFEQGLDYNLLGFFRYATGKVFTLSEKDAKEFDPQGRWLLDHEEARPFGDAAQ